jgi:hypothetical protein
LPVAPPADADVDDYIAYLAAAVGTATTAASTASAAASTASAAASSASASASTATTKAAEASASAATVAASTAKLNQFAGRNLIINGSGRVNQRGYVSGTATTTANQFTLDRWFVVTSGQNLTFTGTDAGRVMTAPAGGVGQVIEGANIVGGTYVINWTGTATCTVGGVARAKGDTFTLAANANVTVRFFSGTFTDVQIELGAVATPFERVDIGLELARCQRYYEKGTTGVIAYQLNANGVSYFMRFLVEKRSVPTIAYSGTTYVNSYGISPVQVNTSSLRTSTIASASTASGFVSDFTADAEL